MSSTDRLSYNPQEVGEELRKGLEILQSRMPLIPRDRPDAYILRFEAGTAGPRVEVEGRRIAVRYAEPCEAFRALGAINGRLRCGKPVESFSERRAFSLISVMLDVSRNAVMKTEELEEFLVRFALMGINSFMLYTECNYEVPGEEFWGHNIGGYSIEKLGALGRFAKSLGIEMFPCIQTLAHLRRALHWDAYSRVKDTETVLLVDEKETYRLLERLIAAAVEPYESRKIHIGMDEAWDLGLGAYLRRNGFAEPYELMSRHLKRVIDITNHHGVEPMIWSDMFFRAGSKSGAYYDPEVRVPPEVARSIPPELSLVYWDYYHFDEPTYRNYIDRHLELVPVERLIMAPGGQTWNRFWTNYPYALATAGPALRVCKEKGLKRIIMTLWGDDGAECDPYSFLPMLQFYAEHAYGDDDGKLRDNLLGSCGMSYDSWYAAGTVDVPPYLAAEESSSNLSKLLLWEDPLHGPLQPQLGEVSLQEHYRKIGEDLRRALHRTGGENRRLLLPLLLTRVLSSKWNLPSRVLTAYKEGRRDRLRRVAGREIPRLCRDVERLRRLHRRYWHESFEPWGWETLDTRYGGLIARLNSLGERITDYLRGRIESIPELENPRYKIEELPDGRLPSLQYAGVFTATPSAVD